MCVTLRDVELSSGQTFPVVFSDQLKLTYTFPSSDLFWLDVAASSMYAEFDAITPDGKAVTADEEFSVLNDLLFSCIRRVTLMAGSRVVSISNDFSIGEYLRKLKVLFLLELARPHKSVSVFHSDRFELFRFGMAKSESFCQGRVRFRHHRGNIHTRTHAH